MVLLPGLPEKGEAVGHDHDDQDEPRADGADEGPLQKVQAEQRGHSVQKHASAQIFEALGHLVRAFDQSQHLEKVVGLGRDYLTMKR